MENFKNTKKKQIFWNYALDKGKLKSFVSWFLKQHGEKKTLELLEQLKVLGFGYATEAGISLGIEDLKIPPQKPKMLAKAKSMVDKSRFLYRRGNLTDLDRTQGFMEVWNEVNENLKDEVVSYFQKTNILNPVYMMAFSGARGNLSQVRQLVGMRGLMSDPQGKIIDFPILSNFREGLTLTEYLISTYGARKGIVDTALRTATAGYLTRRLVDVAQHVVVSKMDCGTNRGIFLFDMKDGVKNIYSFQNRLIGRVLAQDLFYTQKFKEKGSLPFSKEGSLLFSKEGFLPFSKEGEREVKLASRNTEVSEDLAAKIAKVTKRALVRSPLTCEQSKRVCQLCYGWSLATSRLVSIGEAVGVIAGQSIGEPGTQLTMRTFHTGGVFAGNITEQINAPFSGIVEYSHPMAGSLLRVSLAKNNSENGSASSESGPLAFLTKYGGNMILKKCMTRSLREASGERAEQKTYKLPPFTILFARHGEWIAGGSVLAQISTVNIGQKGTQTSEQTVYTSLEGEIFYSSLDLMEEVDSKYGERVSKSEDWAKVWVLSAKILQNPLGNPLFGKAGFQQLKNKKLEVSPSFPQVNDFISTQTVFQEMDWVSPVGSTVFLPGPDNALKMEKDRKRGSNGPNLWKSQKMLQKMNKKNLQNKSSTGSKILQNGKLFFFEKKGSLLLEKEGNVLGSYWSRVPREEKKNVGNKTFLEQKLVPKQTFLSYDFSSKKFNKVSVFFIKENLKNNEKVFLPMLEPGMLNKWVFQFSAKRNRKNHKKYMRNLAYSYSMASLPLKQKFLQKKGFFFFQKKEMNYAEPLFLSNLFPFCLEKKLFQSFKQKRWILDNRMKNTNSFLTKPGFLKKEDFMENFKKAFVYKNKKASFPVTENIRSVKERKIAKKFKMNPRSASGTSGAKREGSKLQKNGNQGFQDLWMKEPILRLPAVSPHYTEIGYTVKTSLFNSKKDCFVSYFPLNQKNKKLVSVKSSNLAFSQSLAFEKEGAKNTNFWQPEPQTRFAWYPSKTQMEGSFLCFVKSPNPLFSFFQQYFALKMKIFTEKKTRSGREASGAKRVGRMQIQQMQQKGLEVLNLCQSQTCYYSKKESTEGLKFKRRRFSSFEKRRFSSFEKRRGFLSPKMQVFPQKKKSRDKTQIFKKMEMFSFLKKTESFSFFSKKVKANFSKKHNPKTSLDVFYNAEQTLYKKSKNENLEKTAFFFQRKGLNKSFPGNAEVSPMHLKQKEKKKVKYKRKILKTMLNQNQKKNLFFTEIFYMPQKNYLFHTLNRNTLELGTLGQESKTKTSVQHRLLEKKQMFYSSTFKPLSKGVNFLLTNGQGHKRKLDFFENSGNKVEGVLAWKWVKKNQKRKSFFFEKNGKKKKGIPEFLNGWNLNSNGQNPYLESYLVGKEKTVKTLKLKFLNYLLLKYEKNKKKNQKPEFSEKIKKTKFLDKKESILVCSGKSKKYFSYVPLFKQKETKGVQHQTLSSVDVESNGWLATNPTVGFEKNGTETKEKEYCLYGSTFEKLKVTFKQGWIYKTRNTKALVSRKKKLQNFGKPVLDDIHFENLKVLYEPVKLSKKDKIEKWTPKKNENFKKKPDFVPSKWLQNKKCRFFKGPFEPPIGPGPDAPKLKCKDIFYLLRPFASKPVFCQEEMKTSLYEKMKKSESLQGSASYEFYKNYQSSNLNPQKNKEVFVGMFPKLDFELKAVDVFMSPQLKTMAKFLEKRKQKKNKKKESGNKQKKTLGKNNSSRGTKRLLRKQSVLRKRSEKQTGNKEKSVEFFKSGVLKQNIQKTKNKKDKLKMKKSKALNRKNQRNFKANILSSETFVLKKRKNKILDFYYKMHVPTYMSNQSLNLSPYNISYKLPNNQWQAYSFPKISFNAEPNGLFLRQSTNKKEETYIQETFNLMLKKRKNKQKVQNHLLSPQTARSILARLKREDGHGHKLKKKAETKFQNLNALFQYFYDAPKFEFSLGLHYSFFLNARLRSSGSWKQSVEQSLQSKVLGVNQWKTENFRVQRILKKKKNNNLISKQKFPIYKNFLNLKKNNIYEKHSVVGVTRFYSPVEGLVLKDYALDKNIENLKRTFNIQLDDVLLQERQGQKLVLTKKDLFSLNLPTLETRDFIKGRSLGANLNSVHFHNLHKKKAKKLEKKFSNFTEKQAFFQKMATESWFGKRVEAYQTFQKLEQAYHESSANQNYAVSNLSATYENKIYKLSHVEFKFPDKGENFRIGKFSYAGDSLYGDYCLPRAGQVIHLNNHKVTFRKAEYFSLLPRAILHTYNGHTIQPNKPVMTLAFETLNSGDIVQGIPKVEQYLEARTTIQGRLFLNSLPVLLYAIYRRYLSTLEMDKAARQSFLKIQQILVDGVQRVYRSQGVGITDKHLEVIVRQMTSKVKIIYGGQTGFFPGELVDLDLVERVNKSLVVKVVYEPVVLGITRASLEVDSFLSAASFQQTTKVLTRAALENKRDFLKGLKENLLVGNLLPAGTGYVVPISNL